MMTKVTVFLMAFSSEVCIPWNAAQYINAWVYRVLNRANTAWGDAAHHAGNRAIRPFSITPLDFPMPVQARAQGLIPQSGAAVLQIGVANGAIAQALLDYALAEPLIIGNVVYYVDAIISTPVITATPIRGFLQSPIVIAQRKSPAPRIFLEPSHPAFWPLVEKNLAHKVRQFAAGNGHADTIHVIVDGTASWHRKLVRLHGRPIIGWMTSAPITISGPPEAGALALTFGLGVYNAHGFGSLRSERTEIANDMLDAEWDAI